MQIVAAAGEDLMSVSLVSNVPNELVVWRVKHVMHCDGQLNGPERGTCVAADARAGVDDELTDLVGNFLKVLYFELPQVGGRIDL
jgi:hypothetical protein